MKTQSQPYKLDPASELARRLAQAREPVILEDDREGVRYKVIREGNDIQLLDEPTANYDPEKVLTAIDTGAGALKGIDVEAFIKEIYDARQQDSSNQPA